ncbi:hypothetical protein UFOVP1590_53 [uncultured Caudovirales phage]|uniref:Uncharacterized protein n=1 Tax=uncultured Caudovirales phage TaxID=2100421 RepID=A0A6J5SQF3_9CAUD|nr:hypothetical protein UFOVP1590_53 [uncultured Caudovirales phage]
MASFNFDHYDGDISFRASYENEDGFLWPEVVENFLQFLRGSGYPINTREFIDYVESRILEVEEAEEDKCDCCGGHLDD